MSGERTFRVLFDEKTIADRIAESANDRAPQVLVCTPPTKPGKRTVPIEADFDGFFCPDPFLVGYRLDDSHGYRELPSIGHVVTQAWVS